MAHSGPWREVVPVEHRLITALLLVCAALLGVSIASAEILGGIDWAVQESACADGALLLPSRSPAPPALPTA